MQTNLSDDMVKLVRYTILSVERDREAVLNVGEEIVTDNMSDEAFSSWMIAKHAPSERRHGDPLGVKYLRVSYQVLGRWAKQDRKFERRQLAVLGDIRDAIRRRAPRASEQPFQQLLEKIELHQPLLASWRAGFARQAGLLARVIAETFNRLRGVAGGPPLELDAGCLAALFEAGAKGQAGIGAASFDQFAGKVWGELVFRKRATGERDKAWPSFAVWDPAREQGGILVQKATLSSLAFFSTEDGAAIAKGQPDVMVNVVRPDLGFVAWRSKYLPTRQEMPFIGYQLADDQLLWINQTDSADLVPFEDKVFLVSLRWAGLHEGRRRQLVTSFSFAIDFDAGTAVATGDELYTALYTVGEDPFTDLVLELRGQRERLGTWRAGFALGKATLAVALANAFARCREVGDLVTIPVAAADIEAALGSATGSGEAAHVEGLDRFAGSWQGLFKAFDLASGEERSAIRQHNVWTPMRQDLGAWLQLVTGSELGFWRPEVLPEPLGGQVDLFVDSFDEQLGLTSWASKRQGEHSETALIGYYLGGGRFLWINQPIDPGSEPGAEATFGISLEWAERAHGKPRYHVVLLTFQVDFATGEATAVGPACFKGTFEQVGD